MVVGIDSVVVGPALVKLAVASSTFVSEGSLVDEDSLGGEDSLVGEDSRMADFGSVAGPVFVGCAVGWKSLSSSPSSSKKESNHVFKPSFPTGSVAKPRTSLSNLVG